MLIKTEEVKILNKGRLKGTSSKTGKEYDLPQIQVQGKDNCNYTLTLQNEFLYEQATPNEVVKIVYYLDPRGNITINSLERIK